MAFNVQRYVLGTGDIPQWLQEQSALGRAKFNYEDGELANVTVFGVPKTKVAKVGDTIALSKSGLVVIPKRIATDDVQEKARKQNGVRV